MICGLGADRAPHHQVEVSGRTSASSCVNWVNYVLLNKYCFVYCRQSCVDKCFRFTTRAMGHSEFDTAQLWCIGNCKLHFMLIRSADISIAMACQNFIANWICSLRRLRDFNNVVVTFASPSVLFQRVCVWGVNCYKLFKRRAEREARMNNLNVDMLRLQWI